MFAFQYTISHIGGLASMISIIGACCIILYVRGYKKDVDVIVFSALSAMCVTFLIKYILQIPRPELALLLEYDSRFPSGHATMAGVVLGLGLYYGNKIHNKTTRIVVYSLSVLWLYLVAYSRVYLGVHLPVDVVVGGGIGVLCTMLTVKIFTHLRYYR